MKNFELYLYAIDYKTHKNRFKVLMFNNNDKSYYA